ncbi:HAMP domain-containing protein [Flavobacterium sp. Sd200]|uniref:HAMP domain-containing sensor histidine kinase n=1 Tax=Flavobacterium sp. Sd200 TaxID=2692211 RepID=UPI00136EE102|nr:HAMP domain-containing sensor histidine kinase [Flavobacterium sp. Sd200]MXN92195.1 HAMP domain-containing protein [Flavobacterium sp. Sd200]
MQIRKKITVTYVTLSCISMLLLCIVVLFLFKRNNEYYFVKRLVDRAKIVASIHYQNDPQKAHYYRLLRERGLPELIEEKDYVLRVNGPTSFEYNTQLHLPPDFYASVMKDGSAWVEEEDSHYYYAQIFDEGNVKYMVIVTARDRRGNTTTLYITRIMIVCGFAFFILAFIFGRFLARSVMNPVANITAEVQRISASNLHNRLPAPAADPQDEISDLAKTFNDMLDRLETSFEIQANFINNASHELKTPVTTIIAETEIALLKEREPEEYEGVLNNIQKQATRLANLTESLLKLTQTGYDGTKQVQDNVRMDELLLDVKCELDKLYPENRITINLNDIPDDANQLTLPCNRPLLELAISNIITNGVKYSDNEEVFVSLSANSQNIKITITDIGIGIPPEDIPYLYEPFFRGKKASRYNGYGLGLPLAMKIIRMHKGELIIQSEPGKGTVVNIVFNTNIH